MNIPVLFVMVLGEINLIRFSAMIVKERGLKVQGGETFLYKYPAIHVTVLVIPMLKDVATVRVQDISTMFLN